MESVIQSIQIGHIKNLVDVTIRLDEKKPLTAIMGPNGYGKSTILHVLAATFQPDEIKRKGQSFMIGEARRYAEFFPGTPHNAWAGTNLKIVNKITDGDGNSKIEPIDIAKAETGPWRPTQENKPIREAYYIGVSSALPEIEVKRELDDVAFSSAQLGDEISKSLIKLLSGIFNREYTAVLDHEVSKEKRLIGLGHGGIQYSSLAMGAGEQRAFKILKRALSCEKNALLLIDEIDLLLHTEALDGLLSALSKIARKKSLQVLFTTHRESVLSRGDDIAIRHIYNQPQVAPKTYCFTESKPGAIRRLTGVQPKKLSICCEDDVAEAIIRKVGQQVGVSSHVDIQQFGAWQNSFTLAAAIVFTDEEENIKNTLLVMDGDIADCDTESKKKKLINNRISGSSAEARRLQKSCLDLVAEFSPGAALIGPERSLYDMVHSLDPNAEGVDSELVRAFKAIEGVTDKHDYVNKPLKILGEKKAEGLARIVNAVCSTDTWRTYTAHVRVWLEHRKPALLEEPELGAS